jgi:type IV secretory pathway TrbF-like protein
MAAILIGGNANQEWVNRGARERAFTRFAASGFFALLVVVIFETAALVYVGSLPREKAVIVAEQRDGSYAPYAADVTPDQAGKVKLIADWFASYRLASTDPTSFAARQTAALIVAGGDVAKQVHDYNQSVVDTGSRVAPVVRSVEGSGFEYQIDWDETIVVPGASTRTQHAMRAYVTIAFQDALVNLHNDPLTNPYGLYVKSLRVVEVSAAK